MTTLDQTPVLEAIRRFFEESGVRYEERRHAPTFTAQEAADARGEALEIGAKAIVAKVGKQFRLFVMPSNRQLASRAICKHLKETRFRFAHRDELHELTGLVPGCVPPFGEPILPLPLYVDEAILQNEQVAFNAGSHTTSMLLSREDYLALARPQELFALTKRIEDAE